MYYITRNKHSGLFLTISDEKPRKDINFWTTDNGAVVQLPDDWLRKEVRWNKPTELIQKDNGNIHIVRINKLGLFMFLVEYSGKKNIKNIKLPDNLFSEIKYGEQMEFELMIF